MNLNSAVVWVIRSDDGLGDSATLQAYRAVPQGHWLTLIHEWPIGQANKFTSPGVWNNTIYAATGDGHVLGFGATSTAPLVGQGLDFTPTDQGAHSPSAIVNLRAARTITVP